MGSPLACTQGPPAMEKYLVIFLLFALSCVFAEPEPFGRRYGYGRGYGGYGRGYGRGYGGYRGHYGKRSADAVATPDADADADPDPYYRSYGCGGYGYRGYGYGGYRGFYGRGYYGKRSADADVKLMPII